MTEAELQAIRERCEKATAGPWTALRLGEGTPQIETPSFGFNCWTDWADRDFIANARTDVPALLALADRLLGKLVAFDFEVPPGEVPPHGTLESAVYGWRARALRAEKLCNDYLLVIAEQRQRVQDQTSAGTASEALK